MHATRRPHPCPKARHPWGAYGVRLLRAARTRAEVLSALRLLASAGIHRLTGRPLEAELLFRGAVMHIALGKGELGPIIDIQADGEYDYSDDFTGRRGWTVVDIGANVGAFSIQQATRGARVIAFEPNPETLGRLLRSANATVMAGSITAYELAIGAAPGPGVLWPSKFSTHRRVVPNVDAGKGDVIAITTLDMVAERLAIAEIDMLKIDVEGSELSVLQGASRTLGQTVRIAVEYHSDRLRQSLLATLIDAGFYLVGERPYLQGVGLLFLRRPQLCGGHGPTASDR